ncbi:hypothetical protein [Nocardioides mesophilus]|uniref:DUF2157 domain-containing protein n=1 Tax=Nocardioides mesophilus TaxID=433659 RepID=A0A7G9RFJ5_9ACTN|nr:hypothetical protein [Nocardioides mesophilus]QNN54370.1 hypothetical protein H9L09_08595 [Nocardioides mesophilus]
MSTQSTTRAVVTALIEAGLLDPSRAGEADPVVAGALEHGTEVAVPLRRRMAEIAGYVGGAFVVGAAVLFLGTTWTDLSLGQQVGLLLVTALVLVAAGFVVVGTAGGARALRQPEEAVRNRLTSVLLTAAAGCLSFAVGLWLLDVMSNEELAVMLAALAGLAAALLGYLVAPTTVGQLGSAAAAFAAIPSGLGALSSGGLGEAWFGVLVLALGVLWLLAAERGWWRELLSARIIGCGLAFFGAQLPLGAVEPWGAYVLTAAVGVAAFAAYLRTRAWPYLATGVVAVTVAVPEALSDWTSGSLGAAGILLVTGVTLLVAALLGLRLRQEAHEQHRNGPHHHAMT